MTSLQMTALQKTTLQNTTVYDGFDIEVFEAGHGLWHARIKRANSTPMALDGVLFPALELGFAWSDRDAAIAHAKSHIDRFRMRYDTAA